MATAMAAVLRHGEFSSKVRYSAKRNACRQYFKNLGRHGASSHNCALKLQILSYRYCTLGKHGFGRPRGAKKFRRQKRHFGFLDYGPSMSLSGAEAVAEATDIAA
jgi:hypothetical protein